MAQQKLIHNDPAATDEALAKAANDHLGKNPQLQVLTELLTKLRELKLPWWTPEQRREALTATDRMRLLVQRPDIRARIMMEVCKSPPKFARRGQPDAQASMLDEFLAEDVSAEDFENAYAPYELVVYGDAAVLFYQFMDAMPFDNDIEVHQALIAAFIESCLNDKREHDKKKSPPVLTHWDVRTAIDPDVWQERIPRELRVAVDKARLDLEKAKPHEKFYARNELDIVGVGNVTKHIPLKLLTGIVEAAAKKMGLERPKPPVEEKPPAEVPARASDLAIDHGIDEEGASSPKA